MSLDLEAITEGLVRAGVPRDRALAAARRELGVTDVRSAEALEEADAREEKAVVAACDKQLRALGFVVVNFSQPRATKQTAGIPDREFFHPGRGVFAKWEAKTANGRQSPAQRQYQEWCDAAGITYLLGTDQVVYDWLVAQGIAVREGALLVPLPYSPVRRSP